MVTTLHLTDQTNIPLVHKNICKALIRANILEIGRMSVFLQFLRPCLLTRCRTPCIAVASAHLRFYNITHSLWIEQKQIATAIETHESHAQLDEPTTLEKFTYPRIDASQIVGLEYFKKTYAYLKSGETVNDLSLTICGIFDCCMWGLQL